MDSTFAITVDCVNEGFVRKLFVLRTNEELAIGSKIVQTAVEQVSKVLEPRQSTYTSKEHKRFVERWL